MPNYLSLIILVRVHEYSYQTKTCTYSENQTRPTQDKVLHSVKTVWFLILFPRADSVPKSFLLFYKEPISYVLNASQYIKTWIRRSRTNLSPNRVQPYQLSCLNPLSDWPAPKAYGVPKHSCQGFVLFSIQTYAPDKKETLRKKINSRFLTKSLRYCDAISQAVVIPPFK